MKNFIPIIMAVAIMTLLSCERAETETSPVENTFTRSELAKIFSKLPMGQEQLREVHDAVSSSSSNGYDEEYMMADLLSVPGAGVGDRGQGTKTMAYSRPLKDMLAEYISAKYPSTKAGAADVEAYVNALSESDLQIYWPYSEDWDGNSMPVITYDPGFGAESNYGYELSFGPDGARVVDSLLVTEEVARCRPVWVINSNDDSSFTPYEMFTKASSVKQPEKKCLKLSSFKMHRNYDSWFAGASEFFVKMGAVDGFKASKDEDLKLYNPSVTDMMIVVKRKDMGKDIPLDAILLTDMTDQMEKLAFLVIEDDGGTTTNWKCSATVKYNSKTYGFDIDIPYKDKDDIVWRGQLATDFLKAGQGVNSGRFGDVSITFTVN